MRKLFSIIAATLFATTMFATTFEPFTGDLVEGDYLITYDGAAMQASVASNRLQFSALTFTGDNVVDPADNLIWHIAKSGDNWTIYNADAAKYAGSTNNKNQAALLDAATTDNALWEASGTYEFANVARAAGTDPNNKWLRKNSTYGFACYASATGGALSLYKKAASTGIEKPVITGDVNFLEETTVSITAEAGCEIYYTDDGSEPLLVAGEPSGSTQSYNAPFKVTATTTVKALAYSLSTEAQSTVAEKTFTKVPQYEVAQAIAATLADGDMVAVRGVVTKMTAKGSNFATYGSLTIYVKDATGGEGEFQFFNSQALNNVKFTATTPAYDPESTTVVEFTSATDANNVKLAVGDTVIGFGPYKLYNTTHELNQGCYLVDIKSAPFVPQTIDITINSGVQVSGGEISEGTYFWQVQAQNDDYYVSLAYVGASTEIAGTYTEADLYADYCVIYDANDNEITMVSANIVVTVNADETIDLAGTFVGSDGNTYNLKFHYAEPKPETTVTVTIDNAELDTESSDEEIGVMGEDATGLYVQLYIYTDEFEGTYDETDLDAQYSAIWLDDDNVVSIYTAEIEVTPADVENGYLVEANLLCYNNTLYQVTMTIPGDEPAAINNVETVKSNVLKAIENGHLFINGVRYNVNGAIVK